MPTHYCGISRSHFHAPTLSRSSSSSLPMYAKLMTTCHHLAAVTFPPSLFALGSCPPTASQPTSYHRFCFQCLPPPCPDQSCSPIQSLFPKYGNSTLTVKQTTARLSGLKQVILSHEPLESLSISSAACGARLSAKMTGSQTWPRA